MNTDKAHEAQSCMCGQLSDTAVVDMGKESDKVFATLGQLRVRGEPYWWLAAYQCSVCGQAWLMGQESRQNDVYCLYRLDRDAIQEILTNNHWPPVFERYEDLLRAGLEAGKQVRFFDPMNAKSLRWTMADVAKARPGITVAELSELFNLDAELAEEIAREVVAEEHVRIDVDRR